MNNLIKAWLCLFVGAVLGATMSYFNFDGLSIMAVTIGGMFFGKYSTLEQLDK